VSAPGPLDDPRVAAIRVNPEDAVATDHSAYDAGAVHEGVRRVGDALGWAADGSAFGAVIPQGARVLMKPNWVLHTNRGGGGFAPLITHATLLRAVADEVLRSRAGALTVGDAPVQGCDFPAMLRASGLESWGDELRRRDERFAGVVDFRRTVADTEGLVHEQVTGRRGLEHFVLFDLAAESLLEPITEPGAFRVTMYDPTLLIRTHAPGRHQYLIAREVLDADVVVNLPKLKTHKKAGVTCALKNLIGINGNKEFLPHHRVGGAGAGGDCYPGRSIIKRSLEHAYDVQNSNVGPLTRRAAAVAARVLDKTARLSGDELGVEGSWSGNDTIWRTCLDLNRILVYGRPDGTLADTPQRTVLNVVDAIVAGQGDGPLSPEGLPLGLLLGGASSAAVDWVGSWLLRYDPMRLPIVRESLGDFEHPLARFDAESIELVGDLGRGPARVLAPAAAPAAVRHPTGWRDAAADVAVEA